MMPELRPEMPAMIVVNENSRNPDVTPYIKVEQERRMSFPFKKGIRCTHSQAVQACQRYSSLRVYTVEDYFKKYGGGELKRKVLILRSEGIGDIIMLAPALRALTEEGWEVTLGVRHEFVYIAEANPWVKHVIIHEPKQEKPSVSESDYSMVFRLNHEVERDRRADQQPRVEIFARLLGVTLQDGKKAPTLEVDDATYAEAAGLLGDRGYIGLAVRTSTHHRDYRRWGELALKLAESGQKVCLLHHERAEAVQHPNIRDLQGQLTVRQLCGVIANLDALVTGDSGPMHIAAAQKIPFVTIEGPTSPETYLAGYTGPRQVAQADLPCLGCSKTHRVDCQRMRGAGVGDHECLKFDPSVISNALGRLPKPKPRVAKAAPTKATKGKVWMTMLFYDEPPELMERFISRVIMHPAIEKVIAVNGKKQNGLSTMLRATKKVDIFDIPYPKKFFGAQANQRNASFMPVPANTPVIMMDPDEEFSPALYDWLPYFAESGVPFGEIARMNWPTWSEASAKGFVPRWVTDPKAERDYQPRFFVWQLHYHWYRAAHHIVLGVPPAKRLSDDRFIMHFREEIADRDKREKQWDTQMAENEARIGGHAGMGR